MTKKAILFFWKTLKKVKRIEKMLTFASLICDFLQSRIGNSNTNQLIQL
jgi:hypothetical protein